MALEVKVEIAFAWNIYLLSNATCFSESAAGAVNGSPGSSGMELDRAKLAEGFSDQIHPGHHPCEVQQFWSSLSG